jgi:hypothetical protein
MARAREPPPAVWGQVKRDRHRCMKATIPRPLKHSTRFLFSSSRLPFANITPCDDDPSVPRHRVLQHPSCWRSSPLAARPTCPYCRRRLSRLVVLTTPRRTSRCDTSSTMAHTNTRSCIGGLMFHNNQQYGWQRASTPLTASLCPGCASSRKP